MQRIKQVIVIRRDLRMRRGKEIAQGSHASLAFLVARLRAARIDEGGGVDALTLTPAQRGWLDAGTAKVCVRVNSETELLDCHQRAREAGLESHLVRDSGRTEFGGTPTLTACAIGPDDAARIDEVTGDLELY